MRLSPEGNWSSVLRETCLCFCGVYHGPGGQTLTSGPASVLSLWFFACWYMFIVTMLPYLRRTFHCGAARMRVCALSGFRHPTVSITAVLQWALRSAEPVLCLCSFSVLPRRLFWVLATPYTLQDYFVDIRKITCWDFDLDCIESIGQVGKNWHLD